MKHWARPSFPPRSAVVLGLALALATTACVTRGRYQQAASERDGLRAERERLEKRVEKLEASSESLAAERVRLLDEMEDLRQNRDLLKTDVRKLERTEELLSDHLRKREAELAKTTSELERMRGTYDGLVQDLEQEVASGQIEIEQLREGLRLNLTQDVLFASGSSQLNTSGQSVVRRVAGRLKSVPHLVEVQGHTDNVPVRASARYASNWELAAARATEVVRMLSSAGVGPERLRAVSFGEFLPLASNASPEGRARNRRIEIRLAPVPGASVPPADLDTR